MEPQCGSSQWNNNLPDRSFGFSWYLVGTRCPPRVTSRFTTPIKHRYIYHQLYLIYVNLVTNQITYPENPTLLCAVLTWPQTLSLVKHVKTSLFSSESGSNHVVYCGNICNPLRRHHQTYWCCINLY